MFTDLVADRSDIGFRGGPPPAGGAIARRLVPIQLIVCASPDYIERNGAPRSIDELAAHRCTGYRRANTGKLAQWQFRVGDEIVYRDLPAAVCVNDTEMETQAVLAGLGIGQPGSFNAARLAAPEAKARNQEARVVSRFGYDLTGPDFIRLISTASRAGFPAA